MDFTFYENKGFLYDLGDSFSTNIYSQVLAKAREETSTHL